jgi:RHS repeat-associated protein
LTYGETASGRSSQYNGRVFDAGTGFHDYGARMYWPQIGRFISADSVMGSPEIPMTLNRYSYVLNNPHKYTDPNGKWPLPAHIGMVISAFGLNHSPLDVGRLAGAQYAADFGKGAQDDQSRHAMRGAGESKVGAQYAYSSFVTGQLRDATVLDQAGDRAGAMKALGLGMHAIMDAFTPQHKDTAEWPKDRGGQASHVVGELAASGLDFEDRAMAQAELGKYMEAFEKRTYTYTPPTLDRASK